MKNTLSLLHVIPCLLFCTFSQAQLPENTFNEEQQYLRSQQEAQERERQLAEPDVNLYSRPEQHAGKKKKK